MGAVPALAAYAATSTIATAIMAAALVSVVTLAAAFGLAAAIRMDNQWQRPIVLRLGKFSSVRGPGLFFMTPLAETVAYEIDLRTIATPFRAEQTMTSDTAPVRRRRGIVLARNRPAARCFRGREIRRSGCYGCYVSTGASRTRTPSEGNSRRIRGPNS